jgi:hypothetical protein
VICVEDDLMIRGFRFAPLTKYGRQRNHSPKKITLTIFLVTKPNSNCGCTGKVGPPVTILAKLGRGWKLEHEIVTAAESSLRLWFCSPNRWTAISLKNTIALFRQKIPILIVSMGDKSDLSICSNVQISPSEFLIWNKFGSDLEGPLLILCRKWVTAIICLSVQRPNYQIFECFKPPPNLFQISKSVFFS